MLKLRYNTEDWRDLIASEIDAVESELGVDNDAGVYDEAADLLCTEVLDWLTEHDVEHERAYQQSHGNWIIIQSGTDAEREKFHEAVEACLPNTRAFIRKLAEQLA